MNKEKIISYFKYKRRDCYAWQAKINMSMNKTVIEIPARSGSTRLPDKNITDVGGIPLLAYSILMAKKLANIDRVIVNTDSEHYAEIARSYGAEVPFIRPKEFSEEKASLADSSFFLRRWLMDENYPIRRIITLLPTSPFRNLATMDTLVNKLQIFWRVRTSFYTDTLTEEDLFFQSEKGETLCAGPNGSAQPDCVTLKSLGYFSGVDIRAGKGKSVYDYTIRNPIEAVDVDTQDDLELARYIVDNKLYDFGTQICAV
jgi:N-acylneuraminate cytidylyltransferase